MKKIFVLAGMAFLASCADKGTDAAGKINQNNLKEAQELAEKANQFPQIKFEETTHDFGEIKQGVEVQTLFNFKNTAIRSELLGLTGLSLDFMCQIII